MQAPSGCAAPLRPLSRGLACGLQGTLAAACAGAASIKLLARCGGRGGPGSTHTHARVPWRSAAHGECGGGGRRGRQRQGTFAGGGSRARVQPYTVYASRFWVLAVYSTVGMMQCCSCFTLTSLPSSSMAYFSISRTTLNYVFKWGPIMNAVAALPASMFVGRFGLAASIRLAAAFASTVRH